MIDGSKLSPWEPIYTFVASDGTNIHIHAMQLRTWLLMTQKTPVYFPVMKDLAHQFIADNAVSMERVIQLDPDQMWEPVILCRTRTAGTNHPTIPDWLFVDGHHRYVRFLIEQRREILAFRVEPWEWERFQVNNIREETRESLRDMPVARKRYWK